MKRFLRFSTMASSEILESRTMSSTPLCLTLWLCQWKRSLLPWGRGPQRLRRGRHRWQQGSRPGAAPAPPALLGAVTGPSCGSGAGTLGCCKEGCFGHAGTLQSSESQRSCAWACPVPLARSCLTPGLAIGRGDGALTVCNITPARYGVTKD